MRPIHHIKMAIMMDHSHDFLVPRGFIGAVFYALVSFFGLGVAGGVC